MLDSWCRYFASKPKDGTVISKAGMSHRCSGVTERRTMPQLVALENPPSQCVVTSTTNKTGFRYSRVLIRARCKARWIVLAAIEVSVPSTAIVLSVALARPCGYFSTSERWLGRVVATASLQFSLL